MTIGKVKSHLFRIVLSVVIAVCASAFAVAKNVTVDNIVYKINTSTGTATVTGPVEGKHPSNVTIRKTVTSGIENYTVTKIDASAFCYLQLKSITLPSTLQSIGERAFFDNDKLRSVVVRSATPHAYGKEAFESAVEYYADLRVVPYAVDAYKAAAGWKNWRFIDAIGTGGIDSVEAEGKRILSVDISGRAFTIDGAEGRQVSVFDVRGVEVARFASYRGEEVSLPGGVYLVSACGATVKVAL